MALSTLQPLAYAVAYVTFFFGIASTVLRFYSRHYVLKTFGWDDYIAFAILVRLFEVLPCLMTRLIFVYRYWLSGSRSYCTCSCTGDVGCKRSTWVLRVLCAQLTQKQAHENPQRRSNKRYPYSEQPADCVVCMFCADVNIVAVHRRSGVLHRALGHQISFPQLLPAPVAEPYLPTLCIHRRRLERLYMDRQHVRP
jgi:hypothetical protein